MVKSGKWLHLINILFPLVLSATFILHGITLIPYLGIQNDEALIAGALYDPGRSISVLSIFHHKIPMMQMSYLGALKAWIYAPIFSIWKPSQYSLRIPALVLGAVTIWLCYLLIRCLYNTTAAVIGSILLASDTIFLLTTCFDWGPVVLQHLLLVAGLLALVKWHLSGSRSAFALGFACFGLALWDKALAGWTLIAMTMAGLVLFPATLRKYLTRKNVIAAFCWLCLGALPLIRYNLGHRLETFRNNIGYTTQGLEGKLTVLRGSLDGSGLLGYLVFQDPGGNPQPPETLIEKLSFGLSRMAGNPIRTPTPYMLLGALLALPLVWKTPARKPMLFAMICACLVWTQMFFARGGGGSVHHTVLLWPWPQLFLGCCLAGIADKFHGRGMAIAVFSTVILSVSNFLVTNQYRVEFFQNGGAGSWTDALGSLYDFLQATPAKRIVITDWGIFEPMRLLSKGRLPLEWGGGLVDGPVQPVRIRQFREVAETPGQIFVVHTDPFEEFHGVNQRLRDLSAEAGYQPEVITTICDRNGRAVFEALRFTIRNNALRRAP